MLQLSLAAPVVWYVAFWHGAGTEQPAVFDTVLALREAGIRCEVDLYYFEQVKAQFKQADKMGVTLCGYYPDEAGWCSNP